MKRQRPPRGVSIRATDRITEDDRRWFEVRPARRYRARPWVKGESPPWDWGRGNPYVIVHQLRPGVRARLPISWPGPPLELAPEGVLAEMWLNLGGGDPEATAAIDRVVAVIDRKAAT